MLLASSDLLLPVNVSELKNISILLDVFDHVINIPAFLDVGVVNLITHINVPEVAIGARIVTSAERMRVDGETHPRASPKPQPYPLQAS